jgi:hypothetical protein
MIVQHHSKMHKLINNLIKIDNSKLGVLSGTTAILGKCENESLSDLMNSKSDNWWWKSINRNEIDLNYYAVVLFISYIDHNRLISINQYTNLVKNKNFGTKIPISSIISGIMIGDIVFIKDIYKDNKFKMNFEIKTNDDLSLIGIQSNAAYLRGLFDIRNCPFYSVIKI